MAAWQLTYNGLMTAWWLFDKCLTTARPDNHLRHYCESSPRERLLDYRNMRFWVNDRQDKTRQQDDIKIRVFGVLWGCSDDVQPKKTNIHCCNLIAFSLVTTNKDALSDKKISLNKVLGLLEKRRKTVSLGPIDYESADLISFFSARISLSPILRAFSFLVGIPFWSREHTC